MASVCGDSDLIVSRQSYSISVAENSISMRSSLGSNAWIQRGVEVMRVDVRVSGGTVRALPYVQLLHTSSHSDQACCLWNTTVISWGEWDLPMENHSFVVWFRTDTGTCITTLLGSVAMTSSLKPFRTCTIAIPSGLSNSRIPALTADCLSLWLL